MYELYSSFSTYFCQWKYVKLKYPWHQLIQKVETEYLYIFLPTLGKYNVEKTDITFASEKLILLYSQDSL